MCGVKVAHIPAAVEKWVRELARIRRERNELLSGLPEWFVRQAYLDLVMDEKFLAVLAIRPEAVAALPVVSAVLLHTLVDVKAGREPSTRVLVSGEGGVGKTTIGFYLTALPWGMANGLCEGDLGKISVDPGRDEPPYATWEEVPSIDCNFGHMEREPPPQWEWMREAVVFSVEDLARALEGYLSEIESGKPPRLWAFMFDEAGSGDISAPSFFLSRDRYAAASMLVPLLRTATPHLVATTISTSRVGVALREFVNYTIYMATLPPKGDTVRAGPHKRTLYLHGRFPHEVAMLRMDSTVPPFGSSDRPRMRLLQGRQYLLKGSVRMPDWYHAMNIRFRRHVAKRVLELLEERRRQKEEDTQ